MIDKVYTPTVIEETPFPYQGAPEFTEQTRRSGSEGSQIYKPRETVDNNFPIPQIATDLIGVVLNTKSRKILSEFQFTEHGAIQVGKYTPNQSGDIRISPGGITARNSSGDNTFSLDGDTGDAVFAGTVQSGTTIAGRVVVGDNTWIIDGNPDAPRMLLYNNGIPEILIGRKSV